MLQGFEDIGRLDFNFFGTRCKKFASQKNASKPLLSQKRCNIVTRIFSQQNQTLTTIFCYVVTNVKCNRGIDKVEKKS